MSRKNMRRSREQPRSSSRWGKRLLVALVVLSAPCIAAIFILTDPAPSADARAAPTAEQVGAGRDAAYQLRGSRNSGSASRISWGPEHLDGISALASDGFRPDRLNLAILNGALYVTASHALPAGRWLNVDISARPRALTFPETRLRVGSVSLSPYWSRQALEAAIWLLRLSGADISPVDELVRHFSVSQGRLSALIRMPSKSGILDELAGRQGGDIDPALVAAAYCRLADAQRADPQPDFAMQVRRAFPPTAQARAGANRASFIALAMFVVDRRAGYLAGLDDALIARCAMPPVETTLHGRSDLPKHWALSAALAAGGGVQLARAMGEWKELADSLSTHAEFQRGDPTGFSFIDLAADRSGFRVANAAISDNRARDISRRLSRTTPEALLPSPLLTNAEGLKGDEFKTAYGGIDDPRYLEAVGEIDEILDRSDLLAR